MEFIDDSLLHGSYVGTLDGQPVVMDQFLRIRNGVPKQLVRVVRSVQGSAPVPAYESIAYVLYLLEDAAVVSAPALAKD